MLPERCACILSITKGKSVIDSRTVSIPFEELLQKETRVAVVSGRLKTEAVCSALEGGIVNVLICDEDIARGIVVRIHEKERI